MFWASGSSPTAAASRACWMVALENLSPYFSFRESATPSYVPFFSQESATLVSRLGPNDVPRTMPVLASVSSPQSRHSHVSVMWHVVMERGGGGMSVFITGTILTVFRFAPPHEPHLSGV